MRKMLNSVPNFKGNKLMHDNKNQTAHWPEEIRLNKTRDKLTLTFAGGRQAEFSAELLRVMSPSAEVQSHSPSQRQLVAGKRRVLISAIEPVGNYAVKILFSDGHATGIYSWDYFNELADEKDQRWANYLAELAAAGKSRD
jgi:DUF971 family protein